ncbi:MAG: cation:proton antiporter [Hyphomicrobiales bacterium]|nr:cation:proton antiporter [Hyphomicrobiales bacterium]
MDEYVVILTLFGVIVLITAWAPMLFKELPLTLPIACVAIGAAIFSVWDVPYAALHPTRHPVLTERFAEFVVIIALMGAGLKLDGAFHLKSWTAAWRLLTLAMPLTILALTLLGQYLLGLGLVSALLLAAALAPTDPVLASDVQVGPPREGKEDAVRFSLTAEAGLNDGLAFPFVHLALALALAAAGSAFDIAQWFSFYVLWKLGAGAVIGWAAGKFLGWIIFSLPRRAALSRTGDGFVALGVTCIAYGVTEMAQGYGFIAVFVAALGIRAAERDHAYHDKMHDFIEQLERLLMMVLLVLFGGALVQPGALLEGIGAAALAFAVLAIFVVRPFLGWVSLAGVGRTDERAVTSFFGIRGVGSVYYLAYGLNRGEFDNPDLLWSLVSLIVLMSIIIHGVTVTPVMQRMDRRRGVAGRDADDI